MPTATISFAQFVSANMNDSVTNAFEEAERLVRLINEEDKNTYLIQAMIGIITDIEGRRRRAAFDSTKGVESSWTNGKVTIEDFIGGGHIWTENHVECASPAESKLTKGSHSGYENQAVPAPLGNKPPGRGQHDLENHQLSAPSGTSRPAQFREHWAELLDVTGLSANGGRKRVGDMTEEDLLANIEHREQLAMRNLARADQFRWLHKLLTEQHVATVAEIKVQ